MMLWKSVGNLIVTLLFATTEQSTSSTAIINNSSSRPEDHQVRLQNGRLLGYAEYGPKDGFPVLYCHGFPFCRREWNLFVPPTNDDNLLEDLKIRLIIPDRPGYGLSDWNPDCRQVAVWVTDVKELLEDHLQIIGPSNNDNDDRLFSVLGVSGGAPYAAACAHTLSNVKSLGIVSGMGPAEAPGTTKGLSWTIPRVWPGFVRRLVLWVFAYGARNSSTDPVAFAKQCSQGMCPLDQTFLNNNNHPERQEAFVNTLKEAFREGVRGADSDAESYRRHWGFDLQEISCNTCLWHGTDDANVPVSVARWMAEQIPTCRQTNILENEGHLTIACNHMRDILSTIVQ
ncbi:Alpha beta hydrolase fold [Seminavis robusta]|uniref:Alpha beta hydrolase fold n=1 Tax=Seminavis robusta TaxID=568900 RepID=A0A9N8EFR3_9STRA|nr:Alpha beta hydrolase fold [Seminavis robusta]|eukprot:Sro870_g213640.1 Alpha beta hydrolase fold (342) ;mRNA; r:10032-11057